MSTVFNFKTISSMVYIIKLCVVYILYLIKYHNQVMMKRYYIGTNENNFLLIEPLLFLVNQKCWTCFNPIGILFHLHHWTEFPSFVTFHLSFTWFISNLVEARMYVFKLPLHNYALYEYDMILDTSTRKIRSRLKISICLKGNWGGRILLILSWQSHSR